jgi:gliding motility-associated-like protein
MQMAKCICRLIFVGVVLASGLTTAAQEICDNGIDDDGDGLIDLRDPDCQCHFTLTNNLLQNGSFELYNHCPVVHTYDSSFNVATFWQYGTHTTDIDFYHNFSCDVDSQQVMLRMPPAFPLPDGNAFIAILNSAYIDPIPENQMAKGYVGQCLQSPLKQGEQYTLSFYAGRFKSWDNLTGKLFPFTVAIFGNANCNAIPFGKSGVFGNGCPANYPGWVLLGKTRVNSAGQWVQSEITFTVPSDISVIQIGTDCSILPAIVDLTDSTTFLDYHFYYLDDIHLLPTKEFPFEYIHAQTGTACAGNGVPVLEAPVFANASYQWYRDSIAINGATGATYQPGDSSRVYYNVLISTPGKCVITEPFFAMPSPLSKIHVPPDTILCSNSSLVIAPDVDGLTYEMNGVSGNSVTISQQGSYSITATDIYGCQRTFDVNVVEQKCEECAPHLPTAFTPNGDGLNDVFRPKLFCNISQFDLQIFNRWGQKLFESRNSGDGWDGTYLGTKMMSGVYVFVMKYKTTSHLSKTSTGTVALIR